MKKFANWLFRKTHNDELVKIARIIRDNRQVSDSEGLIANLHSTTRKHAMIDALEILDLIK